MPVDLKQTFAIPVSSPEEEEAFREIEQRQAGLKPAAANVVVQSFDEHLRDYRKTHPDYTTRSYQTFERT